MEGRARVVAQPLVDALGQPLEVLAEKRIGCPFSDIENDRLVFVPTAGHERTDRLVHQIDIDQLFRDEEAQGLHLLRKLDEGDVFVFRKRYQFFARRREIGEADIANECGELTALKIAQRLECEAFAPVTRGSLDLSKTKDDRHDQRQRQREIRNSCNQILSHEESHYTSLARSPR